MSIIYDTIYNDINMSTIKGLVILIYTASVLTQQRVEILLKWFRI